MSSRIPRRAVVTGAASGLGKALSLELAARGCELLLLDVQEEPLAAVKKEIEGHGVRAETFVGDVANMEVLERAAAHGLDTLGPVDFVANNAGVAVSGPFEEISLQDWEWIVGINMWGVIYGCRAFVPQLRAAGGGAILNVASAAGLLNAPRMSPYNVTKAAVISLSETLSTEYAREGITVSALCPTFFETAILDDARGIFRDNEMKLARGMMKRSKIQAADVAKIAIDQALAGKSTIVPMNDGRWLWRLKRAIPEGFPRLARMAYERGRQKLDRG
jgi:NAD(P)-dependent dehydrogenase (short-subunit alcohol dehydrogenase family)